MLSWLANDADAQVAFAMMVFPIAMNIVQVRRSSQLLLYSSLNFLLKNQTVYDC
jgi:hypothetical protein